MKELVEYYKSFLAEAQIGADYPDTPEGRAMLSRHHKKVYSLISKAKDKDTKERLYLIGRKLGMDLHRQGEDIALKVPGGQSRVTRINISTGPKNKEEEGFLRSGLGLGVRIPNRPEQVKSGIDALEKLRGKGSYTGPRQRKKR
jgi:hypothetical protein